MMAVDQFFSPPILVASGGLVLTWIVLHWWRRNSKLPPGPWGLPFFGYYPFISKMHLDFTRLSRKYGNVFSFRTVGGRLIIVLNGHRTIKDVLVNRAKEFVGRPHGTTLLSWLSGGIGITQEEGLPWSEQRRFFLQTAKHFGFGKQEFEQNIQDEIKTLLQELCQSGEKPNDLRFHLAFTFNSIISQVLFNRKFDKDVIFKRNLTSMNNLIHLFTGVLHMLIGLPFYFRTRILKDTQIPKGREEFRNFVNQVVDQIRQNFDPSNPKCYVESFLQQRDELLKKGKLQESSFTDQRLKANARNLFFEGTESVSATILKLLVELSKHPDVQKKAQEELDSVVGRERLPSWVDKQNLPYLDATIQELYRVATFFFVTTMYSNFGECRLLNLF